MQGAPMKTITLTATHVCAHTDEQTPEYVFFTGGIAGISDTSPSKADTKPLDRSADEVKLNGD